MKGEIEGLNKDLAHVTSTPGYSHDSAQGAQNGQVSNELPKTCEIPLTSDRRRRDVLNKPVRERSVKTSLLCRVGNGPAPATTAVPSHSPSRSPPRYIEILMHIGIIQNEVEFDTVIAILKCRCLWFAPVLNVGMGMSYRDPRDGRRSFVV